MRTSDPCLQSRSRRCHRLLVITDTKEGCRCRSACICPASPGREGRTLSGPWALPSRRCWRPIRPSEHKLDVLRRHCDDVGRDYEEIQKTVIGPLDPGPAGEHVDELLESMRHLAALGITHYHGSVPEAASVQPLELLGQRVIPAAATF